jgi:hypothetical protein
VRQVLLPRFREERAAFALRYTCEQCTYFDPASERCTHGYPNGEHRDGCADQPELVFCKEFELM